LGTGVGVDSDTFKATQAYQQKQAKLDEIRRRKYSEKEMSLYSWASSFTTQTIVNNSEEMRQKEIQESFHNNKKMARFAIEKDPSSSSLKKKKEDRKKKKGKKGKKGRLSSKPLGHSLDKFGEGAEVNIDKFLGDYSASSPPSSPTSKSRVRRPSGLDGRNFSITGDVELSNLSSPTYVQQQLHSQQKSKMTQEERLSMLEKMASEVSQQHNVLTNVLNQTDSRTEAKLLVLKKNKEKHNEDPKSTRLSFNPGASGAGGGVDPNSYLYHEQGMMDEAIRRNQAEARRNALNRRYDELKDDGEDDDDIEEDEEVRKAKELLELTRKSVQARKQAEKAGETSVAAQNQSWGLFGNSKPEPPAPASGGGGGFWETLTDTFAVPPAPIKKGIDNEEPSSLL
jgi:hypothetical protein